MRHYTANRHGFTLIELLVVIAIISILASIIFPVFSAAKDKGRQTVCLSNLRQLGSAMRMYADEWDGCYPTARVVEGGEGNPQGNWAGCYFVQGLCDPTLGQIYPYVASKEMYICPSAKGARPRDINDPNALPYPLSYSMNDGLSFLNADMMKAPQYRVGLLLHEDIKTINDGDFNWSAWAGGPGGYDSPASIHTGGTCVIYCDLHAKWENKDAILAELKSDAWDPYIP
jgi:prepilin-type N-terminal cleavage/methylation domain-containing protein